MLNTVRMVAELALEPGQGISIAYVLQCMVLVRSDGPDDTEKFSKQAGLP